MMNYTYHLQKICLLTPIGLISYFAPLQELMFAIWFFILIDTVTGIWAAYTNGEKIHSSKSRQFVVKFITYMIALIVAFVFDKHIINSLDMWTTRAIAFVLATRSEERRVGNQYR